MPDAWAPAPPRPVLAADEVHVWRATLRRPAHELRRLEEHLSAEERERAGRYRFPLHRDRFVAGRGIQREILARYLGCAPAAPQYAHAAHGKPSLGPPHASSGLQFNVSNADDGLLVALTLDREVGVDLERLREMPDGSDIAERFFSAPEVEVFRALPAEQRDLAFFTCWTRKEAFIKVVGEGLSMPLSCFDVTLRPGEPAELLRTRGGADEASRWTLREIDPGPGWLAALAVEGPLSAVRLYDADAETPALSVFGG